MTQQTGFYVAPPSDRELDAATVREIVREQFPDLACTTIVRLGDGWEHEAYLVDNQVVFRFPRQAGGGDDFEWEEGVHALVWSAIGDMVGIPRITRWGKPSARFPYPFAGHAVIRGIDAGDPGAPRTSALADDFGRVLARLHAIPEEAAVRVGVGTADVAKADLAAGRTRVRRWVSEMPTLRSYAPDACAWLDDAERAPDVYRGPVRFIHDDFQMEHVIVDPTTGRLSGIIDWGGALGDPARDFSYVLLHGGWSFFQRAMAAYDLPVDADFSDRTLFSARLGALGWFADAVRRGGGGPQDLTVVRRVFDLA